MPDGTVMNMDCIEGMKLLGDGTMDLIVTDPPFGIEFGKKANRSLYNRDGGHVMEGYVDVPKEDYYAFSYAWLEQAKRVLKEDGSMYIFSGWSNLKDLLVALDELGLTVVNHIIWKYNFGVYTTKKYVTSHYHVLYVAKNPKKVKFYTHCRFEDVKASYKDREDVWNIKREYWTGQKKVPTKLPEEAVAKAIAYSSLEGHTVLDPFAGGGTVPCVANKMGETTWALR